MRAGLLVLHRWVALVAGVFVFIVAATGSALVFEGAMDRALYPDLWRVTPSGVALSLDTLIARARAAAPGMPVAGITLPPADDRADVVQAGLNQVFVNPYTGAVLGQRTLAQWNATLPRRLHVLHVSLIAGRAGEEIVAAITTLSLFLALTGLILWWRDKIWRMRSSASWKRLVFDLHHSLGATAATVIAIITLSAMVMHYGMLNSLMYRLDRTAPAAPPAQPAAPAGATPISADSLSRVAHSALPGARLMFLSLSPTARQPFLAAMRFPEDHTPGGRSRVVVDRFTGRVLMVTSTRQAELGTRLGNAIRSIHTGDLFGRPTEAIWLLAAIVLATQAVSGVLMWWNGRRGRAAVARAGTRRSRAESTEMSRTERTG